MKKTVLVILITITTLVGDNLLKEGVYSWYGGGATASLRVKKDKANGYGIFGEAIDGISQESAPQRRELSFTGFMKNGQLFYREGKGVKTYLVTLTLREDGSFDIAEEDFPPFIHTVRFAGHFVSDKKPSFDCTKAKSFTEKAICNNKGLGKLDRKMAKHYSLLKSGFFYRTEAQKHVDALKAEQREWVKKRNLCKIEEMYLSCYEYFYFQRIKQLTQRLDGLLGYQKRF